MESVSIDNLLDIAKKGIDVSLIQRDENEVLKPIHYLRQKPYEAWVIWSKLLNHWLKVPEDKFKIIFEIFEFYCDAIFITDDIYDEGLVRRGQKASYLKYGYPLTVACIEYVHYKIMELILALDHPDAMKIYLDIAIIIFKRQADDIVWIEKSRKFTFEEYMRYGGAKTTTIFALLVKLMQLFSPVKIDLDNFLNLFGNFFFIANDHENLFRSEEAAGELHFADDLTEGKYTFPTIYAIDILKDEEVYDILMSKPKDIESRRRCVEKLRSNGTCEFSLKVIKRFYDEVLKEGDRIGSNPHVKEILDFYMDFDLLK
ncbi:hypothetical protein PVAND_015730 [Polypedilum vanderplanki]|uniref:Polyprenyl synthetase n=1 Tax=Polypedilum vanderplanki TaxID=319348 RepID=A0A9J6BDT9_POLVA|nr:hypothetical protein PVAND_015730 [Polypedilum vanderplanki]